MAPINDSQRLARALWRNVGDERPPFAIAPKAGQESVWDYPRPPRIAADTREVVVRIGSSSGVEIVRSHRALRVLETASPPTFYLPRDDVRMEFLIADEGSSHCEWKGAARYWAVEAGGRRLDQVGWSYDSPLPAFEAIRGCLSFYPARLYCTVDGIAVAPQAGGFYGGWVTPEIVGPFKGEPGSQGW